MRQGPLLPGPGVPAFHTDLPVYPTALQLVRVTAGAVPGPAGVAQVAGSSVLAPILYVSFVQQLRTDSLLPRDREPCLAADVRGLGLSPGFYLGRLSGSWSSLPVYEIISEAAAGGGTVVNWVDNTVNWNNVTINIINNDTTINLIGGDLIINGPNILIINAPFELCGPLYFCYDTVTVNSDAELNLDVEDDKALYRITGATADRKIYGINPSEDLRSFFLHNVSSWTYTLMHESTSAGAVARRLSLPRGSDLHLRPGDTGMVWYDPLLDRYRAIGDTGRVMGVISTGGNYTVTNKDLGHLIDCTGALTVSLQPGATARNGFYIYVRSQADADVDIQADGVEAINGSNTQTLSNRYDMVRLTWTGSEWAMFPPYTTASALDQVKLSAQYTVTASWADTGLSVTLPADGDYDIQAEVTAVIEVTGSTEDQIHVRLWDDTAGSVIDGSKRIAVTNVVSGVTNHQSAPCGSIYEGVAAGTVIKLQAQRLTTGVVVNSYLDAGTIGDTTLRYTQIR